MKNFIKAILLAFLFLCLGNHVINAQTYILTYYANGPGSVSASPTGSSFASGTIVTLTALPAAGYSFVGWVGDTCHLNPGRVIMNANKTVYANFSPLYNLTVTASPSSYGYVTGAGSYTAGTVMPVTANPFPGFKFKNWTGDATGTTASINVTMNGNKSITGVFDTIPTHRVITTVTTPGTGSVGISSSPYYEGKQVTFTATPASGYIFTGWSNGVSGTSNPLTISMPTSDITVTATFSPIPWNMKGLNVYYSQGNLILGQSTQKNSLYKLDVYGLMRANDITVNSDGADFVFEEGYKLRSLTELETYIKANRHLPEIASASTMQSNGMTLGEVQTRLLQKIEELTLYLIEKDKQLDAQQKKTEEQQNEISRLKVAVEELRKVVKSNNSDVIIK
jgi:Listeria-Bacteroides repeat domain (List_Bact_rpt).